MHESFIVPINERLVLYKYRRKKYWYLITSTKSSTMKVKSQTNLPVHFFPSNLLQAILLLALIA
jgi:hypothetical protein